MTHKSQAASEGLGNMRHFGDQRTTGQKIWGHASLHGAKLSGVCSLLWREDAATKLWVSLCRAQWWWGHCGDPGQGTLVESAPKIFGVKA